MAAGAPGMPPAPGDPGTANGPPAAPATVAVANAALRHGFVILPRTILHAPSLSRDAKLLYAVLLSYAWQEGSCFPGYERLRADMGCGINQITTYMRELASVPLITRHRRGQGKTTVYTLLDMPEATPPPAPLPTPILFHQNGETETQIHQNGETGVTKTVKLDSPKRGKDYKAGGIEAKKYQQEELDLIEHTRTAMADSLEPFSGRGYDADDGFYLIVGKRYPKLDLEFQALCIADWLKEDRHRQRRASRRFILNWLDKANAHREEMAADRAKAGTPGTPTTAAPIHVPLPDYVEQETRTWEEIQEDRVKMRERMRSVFRSVKGRGGAPAPLSTLLPALTPPPPKPGG